MFGSPPFRLFSPRLASPRRAARSPPRRLGFAAERHRACSAVACPFVLRDGAGASSARRRAATRATSVPDFSHLRLEDKETPWLRWRTFFLTSPHTFIVLFYVLCRILFKGQTNFLYFAQRAWVRMYRVLQNYRTSLVEVANNCSCVKLFISILIIESILNYYSFKSFFFK